MFVMGNASTFRVSLASIKNRSVPSGKINRLRKRPSLLNNVLLKQAQCYASAMQISKACETFQLAEDAGFDADACAGGRWTCHMLRGDFASAWNESDAIARRGNPDPHRFWNGQSFENRHVLIRCLHGLGDTLQYIRYAPMIRARAATLTVEVQPPLRTLLERANVADSVITWGEREPFWEQQIEIVELPLIFRTTIDSIPANVPYIDVPRDSKDDFLSSRRPLRVGLVWASSSFNPARSLSLSQLAILFELPNVSFFSFQAGNECSQLFEWSDRIGNLYRDNQSVLETAIGMKSMDLVISVDTMTAHLAGAMGLDVWTLLPYACDWRWMLDRRDSPWYPTMRLFRQHTPGAWEGVIQSLYAELAAKVQYEQH
jgi:hypothetical protein